MEKHKFERRIREEKRTKDFQRKVFGGMPPLELGIGNFDHKRSKKRSAIMRPLYQHSVGTNLSLTGCSSAEPVSVSVVTSKFAEIARNKKQCIQLIL